jgi:hypothetical protein
MPVACYCTLIVVQVEHVVDVGVDADVDAVEQPCQYQRLE